MKKFKCFLAPEVCSLVLLMKPYIKQFICMLTLMTLSAVIFFILPLLTRDLMDEGFIPKNAVIAIKISVIMILLFMVQQIAEFIKEKIRTKIKAKIIINLYKSAFCHICKVKYLYMPVNVSKVYNQIQNDITNISKIADNAIFFIFIQILNVIGGMVGLFFINWKLAIIVLFFIPLKYMVIHFLAKRRKILSTQLIKNSTGFAQWFENTVLGIKEIRLFQLYTVKQNEIEILQIENTDIERKIDMYTAANSISDYIMTQSLTCIVYIIGIFFVLDESMSIGSIFAFVTYIFYVTTPTSAILNIRYMLAGIVPSVKRYIDFLAEPEEVYEGIPIQNSDDIAENEFLRFSNVSFKYLNTDLWALRNVDFFINKGEKIALIGENGSGKTTLFHLLLRFYDTDFGSIYLYNKNIQLYNLNEYRNMYSIIDQNIYLFEGSIEYNIILNKKYDEERLTRVIQDTDLADLLQEKGRKYNIGSNGKNLSGGQKQKIALARAIYQDHCIYFFDEATSNLDVHSKKIFCDLMNSYLKDKTVIVITHDESILQYMDRKIYLNKTC
ncbi:MAG: hypothetical protein H6Q70_1279 [Firmicutes bacterium]|nr:hypothetical protein [Bacillota bacterium]